MVNEWASGKYLQNLFSFTGRWWREGLKRNENELQENDLKENTYKISFLLQEGDGVKDLIGRLEFKM